MSLKGEEYLEADEIVDLTKQMICSVFAIFHYFFLSFIDILSSFIFFVICYNFDTICNHLYFIVYVIVYSYLFRDLTKQVICCSLTLFDTRSQAVTQTSAEIPTLESLVCLKNAEKERNRILILIS